MEGLKRFEPVFLLFVILGGLNWLIMALFETNLVTEIFGAGTLANAVYVIVGICALMLLPRLMDGMSHMGDHHARAHRA